MIGGNPLVQFGAYLLTGFSQPSNVEGSQVLAAGWINDMFEGTQTCTETSCFYADPGETITIPTRFGPAFGLVQPEPGVLDSLAREVTAAFFGLLAHINFATDVPAAGRGMLAVPTAVATGATNGVTGVRLVIRIWRSRVVQTVTRAGGLVFPDAGGWVGAARRA